MKLSIKDNYIGNTKLIRILKTAFFVLAVCSIMHAQNNKGKIIILDFEISDMEEALDKPVETAKVNVLGNVLLLEACRKFKIKRYIYASTLYVFSREGGFYRCSKQSAEH